MDMYKMFSWCFRVVRFVENFNTGNRTLYLRSRWYKNGNWASTVILLMSVSSSRMLSKSKRIRLSDTGNRTPVSRVTGGDTSHYTVSDCCFYVPKLHNTHSTTTIPNQLLTNEQSLSHPNHSRLPISYLQPDHINSKWYFVDPNQYCLYTKTIQHSCIPQYYEYGTR